MWDLSRIRIQWLKLIWIREGFMLVREIGECGLMCVKNI
jgi:hypothetical protein